MIPRIFIIRRLVDREQFFPWGIIGLFACLSLMLMLCGAIVVQIEVDTKPPRPHPEPWAVKLTLKEQNDIYERAFEIQTGIQWPGSDWLAYEPGAPTEQDQRLLRARHWTEQHGDAVKAAIQAMQEIVPAGRPR